MKKIDLFITVLTIYVLVACGVRSPAGNPDFTATLDPVPTEYAGLSNPLGVDAIAEGAIVFKINCASCHGPQGHGDGPAGFALDPKPEDLSKLRVIVRDDYLYWRINKGRDGTAMVAWKGVLTDKQIWQVVAFIKTLK
jgi:mono/diheme cytochrome c family protein